MPEVLVAVPNSGDACLVEWSETRNNPLGACGHGSPQLVTGGCHRVVVVEVGLRPRRGSSA